MSAERSPVWQKKHHLASTFAPVQKLLKDVFNRIGLQKKETSGIVDLSPWQVTRTWDGARELGFEYFSSVLFVGTSVPDLNG